MKIYNYGSKILKIKYLLICFVFITITFNFLIAQNNNIKIPAINKQAVNNSKKNVYPDEFSVLDDKNTKESPDVEAISISIEKARSKYISALIRIDKADTNQAIILFESAIDALNELVSYPGIEQNNDFTELAQSIIEDYESIVQNIDKLNVNSNFTVIRDLLFHEVDTISTIQTLPNPTVVKKAIPTPPNTQIPVKGVAPVEPFQKLTIPLEDNEFVQKHLTFLTQDKGRKFFKKWLERSSRWFPMMKQIAAEENMPQEIIYLSMIESGLNPCAVSRAKAVGLWQFIRTTGEMYNLNKPGSVWTDERRDPVKATHAAMQHLRDLYNELGDWYLALSAYNCGINGVYRAIQKADTENPTYWNIRQFLPKETRAYVPLYIATAKIAMQPAAYGFCADSLNYSPEFTYDTVIINESVSLGTLAKCIDITEDALRDYNPELLSSCTPPDLKEYSLRLPKGTKDVFTTNFASLTPSDKQPWITHVVERGETINSIAAQYGVSKDIILSANDSKSYRSKLKPGTKITIPIDQQTYAKREESLALANNKMNNTLKAPAQDQQSADNTVAEKKTSENVNFVIHTVNEGETLYSICLSYGINLADLKLVNVIPDDNTLKVGQKLKIPSDNLANQPVNTPVTKIAKQNIIKHKVKIGETLARIADDYNVSIESITDLNNLKSNRIIEGQVLKIQTNGNTATITQEPPARTSAKQVAMAEASMKKITHKVKKGENLSTISAAYSVTESDLKKWNPSAIAGNKVYAGTKLVVLQAPTQKGSSATTSKKVNKLPKYYTIQSGDTFSSIARKYGVSVESLKKNNKKLSESSLQIGKKLKLQ